MLAETVLFGIFNRKNSEKFPLKFRNKFFVFDDIVLLIRTDMDIIYVFISNGYCITDEKNGL